MSYKKILSGKEILLVRRYPSKDTVYVEYAENHPHLGYRVRWLELTARDAEQEGLVEKTVRLHEKPKAQIKRENLILRLFDVLKMLVCMVFILYSYHTENVVGFGVFSGLFIAALIMAWQDPQKTDNYEKRL